MTTNPSPLLGPLPAGEFRRLFESAFGEPTRPYDWQRELAHRDRWPDMLIAPTGSGKTAGVTLAWTYRRLRRPESTPRRLVWCLPMRTLVDQASGVIRGWLRRLGDVGIASDDLIPAPDDVHVLMGGVDSDKWLHRPERPAVIVGTQDMLLSRALMRGYASSRANWPMEFGTLHEDVQWVFDEVQLMGAGRATSAQLEAFRRSEFERAARECRPAGRPCRSLWISATLEPEWLVTVDHAAPTDVMRVEPAEQGDPRLLDRARAPKQLHRSPLTPESPTNTHQLAYLRQLADFVVGAHRAGRMTLVIVNQVKRAQDLYTQVSKELRARADSSPAVALIHSRFRPEDRKREMGKVVGPDALSDIIVIATQAVEAGVDISAAVMVTELAPWSSMVQRLGRANRYAELPDGAKVTWIDLLGAINLDDKNGQEHADSLSRPYDVGELREARDRLDKLADAAPVNLPPPGKVDRPLRVVRRKDLDDLFDTDADLTGFDVDVSPYVRDPDDTDIRVFWRELEPTGTSDAPPKPTRQELCSVPIGLAKDWVKKVRRKSPSARFFVRDTQWRRLDGQVGSVPPGWKVLREDPWPGLTLMADIRAGGYRYDLGFTAAPKHIPDTAEKPASPSPDPRGDAGAIYDTGEETDGHDMDPMSETGRPVSLADHLVHVEREALALCDALDLDRDTQDHVVRAARWHDLGKAHQVFQDTMQRGLDEGMIPDGELLAKTARKNLRHGRAYFRHELASALAFLACEHWSRDADLIAYLVAAHHGKVRLNIRALPREPAPKEPVGARYARGVWEDDELPPMHLGGDERWVGGRLKLSVMELGWDDATKESWTERTRDLLAHHGPFRLAWLETLLRLADWRASGKEASGGYDGN